LYLSGNEIFSVPSIQQEKADNFSFPVILQWLPLFLLPAHPLNDSSWCRSSHVSSQAGIPLWDFPHSHHPTEPPQCCTCTHESTFLAACTTRSHSDLVWQLGSWEPGPHNQHATVRNHLRHSWEEQPDLWSCEPVP